MPHYGKTVSTSGKGATTAPASSQDSSSPDAPLGLLELNSGVLPEKLTFPDSSFDLVMSFHTVSVVSDPRAMMSEIVRVCRPGGRILIINHFRSDNPLIARVIDSAGNITKRLGWRTDLDMGEVVGELPLRLDHCYKPNRLSFFTVMKATCKPDEVELSAAI